MHVVWACQMVKIKELGVDSAMSYPTLLPGYSLGHAKELVDKFEARLQAQRRDKNGRAMAKSNASSGQQRKKPRGRPRKQT